MRELLKAWCVPGTASSAMVIVAMASPLVAFRQTRAIGIALLAAGAACTSLLALPVVSHMMAARLAPVAAGRPARQADAIVVLAGDSPEPRIAEAVRLFHRFRPAWVIASGSADWAGELAARGIPADRIVTECRARDTHEQAAFVKPLLASRGVRRVFLVASTLQIRRATATFRQAGCDVTPVATRVAYHVRDSGWWRFVPQRSAFALGRDATYEYAAWAYYWWQGWLSPAGA